MPRGFWRDADRNPFIILAGQPSEAISPLKSDGTRAKHHLLCIKLFPGLPPTPPEVPPLSATHFPALTVGVCPPEGKSTPSDVGGVFSPPTPLVSYMTVLLRPRREIHSSNWDPSTKTLTLLVRFDTDRADFHSPLALKYLQDMPEEISPIIGQLFKPLAQSVLEFIFAQYSEFAGVVDRLMQTDQSGTDWHPHLVFAIPQTHQALMFACSSEPKQAHVKSSFLVPPTWIRNRSQHQFVIFNSVHPSTNYLVDDDIESPSTFLEVKQPYRATLVDLLRTHLFFFNETNDDNGLLMGHIPSDIDG